MPSGSTAGPDTKGTGVQAGSKCRVERSTHVEGNASQGAGQSGAERGKMMNALRNLWNDNSGASAAEYALILAIVGSGLAVAAFGLGNTISGAMNSTGNRITDCQDGTCWGLAPAVLMGSAG